MAQSYFSTYHQIDNGGQLQQENKPSWRYQSCDCCPYGYHIDLDFVRYCEALKERADYTGSISKRRERRRQRQSMEVLLGLVTPISISSYTSLPQTVEHKHDTVDLQSALVQDALGDVVTDFERTLECSSGSSGSGSATAAVVNGVILDSESPKGANAYTLKNIRKQMALGLERMRELEEQVKLIPVLQVQVSVLKDEKRKLLEHIRETQSVTSVVSRKEAGVMCGVLTRTIGVGPQYARTRTTSTATEPYVVPSPTLVTSRTSQTMELIKSTSSCSVTAKPDTVDFALQISSHLRTVGVSNDSVQDIVCNKCNVFTRTIGVGPSASFDSVAPVSLKSLSVPRSKSFNLGEEKFDLNAKHRTIGCQSENFSVNRACQYEVKVCSRACQYEPVRKTMSKGIQYDSVGVCSQQTDTLGLQSLSKHVFTNTPIRAFSDVASNTTNARMCDASFNTTKPMFSDASSNTAELVHSKEDGGPIVSRIPRPAQSPASERHKLRRQDTYTKIPTPTTTSNVGLSGIDLSSSTTAPTIDIVDSECSSSFLKAKQNYNIPDISATTIISLSTEKNNVCSPENKQVSSTSASLPVAELVSRTKAVPSKEMQAAMKVLNDSLQKSKLSGSGMNSSAKSHLKNALSIIQQEWFKVSSLMNADPLDVEDYLDRFEEMSSSLLQYVVNMTDDSGNTAMHYAVSHGNFDVVSILLDSKVCNINKPNKAGYTSVMLVSLTEVRSATDATVVRRLFQLADVNVRARQHGQTALMLAVSHGRLDMVQMLLEAGADMNIQDEDGSTALMCAAEHGHIDIVKYFLGHPECDSSIVDVDGSTALKIALEAGHKDIGVLLYAHEHSVHGISPYSSLRQPKAKSKVQPGSVSRSPSRGAYDNKHPK